MGEKGYIQRGQKPAKAREAMRSPLTAMMAKAELKGKGVGKGKNI
jgi:hypothetical protein